MFDVDFEMMVKDFHNFALGEQSKETILEAKAASEQWGVTLNSLLNSPKGGKWANQKIRALKNNCANTSIMKTLDEMKRNRSSIILVNKKLINKWEIDQRKNQNPDMTWEEASWTQESVGNIDGIAALYPENDLQELFIKKTKQSIEAVVCCDIQKMSLAQLSQMSKQSAEIPGLLEKCTESLKVANAFLQRDNLIQLRQVAKDEAERSRFDVFMESL